MDERDPVYVPSDDIGMDLDMEPAGAAEVDEIEEVLRAMAAESSAAADRGMEAEAGPSISGEAPDAEARERPDAIVIIEAATADFGDDAVVPAEVPLAECEAAGVDPVDVAAAIEEMFPPSATADLLPPPQAPAGARSPLDPFAPSRELPCADEEMPDGGPAFTNPIDYADRPIEAMFVDAEPVIEPAAVAEVESREVAIAEPMTAHDAQIVALGDNVRQVTQLIESVGRTLEAQNQRSLRLMERLESVARALEALPENTDRGLEGLDAVQEAITAQLAPIQAIGDRLGELPEVVRAVRDQNDSTRELWSVATRAMAGRMAFAAHEERQRERRDASRRRWRVVASAALAVAAFVGGSLLSATDVGERARVALGTALIGERNVANADEGDRHWHVTRVVPVGDERAAVPLAAVPITPTAEPQK